MPKPLRQQTLPGFDDFLEEARSAPSEPDPQRPLAGETVYVVDAHNLIYQVFHGLPDMTGPEGQPVGAILGFVRDLIFLLESKRPNYLFCAFEAPRGTSFRRELFADYKATREKMPDELRQQIPEIHRMLEAMAIPALRAEKYEADDVLATVARQTEEQGGSCVLVTGDKDCRQLLTDRVRIYNIRKDQLYDQQSLVADWGIRPEQVVDFQSLVGDAVDNIPGVPLIGPKFAQEILERFGSLDQVLAHPDEVRGEKRRENLKEFRDQALLSRQLVRLVDEVPLDVDWVAGRVGGVDRDKSLELCREFGFKQLAEQFGKLTAQDAPVEWRANYRVIKSVEELDELLPTLAAAERLAIDTETTSASPRWAELVGISCAWAEGEAAYIPIQAPEGDPQLELNTVLARLRPLLEDPQLPKVGQNLKYDAIVLRGAGVQLQGLSFDTMVADYLLEAGERNHSLDDLAARYLNHSTVKIHELIGSGARQKQMSQVDVERVGRYAAEDADVPFRLAPILEQRLAEQELDVLFRELEMPLIRVLAELEFNGIRIDVPQLEGLGAELRSRLADLEREIHTMAGGSFNIESPKQLAKVLFDDLQLPVAKRTKSGPSTDAQVLSDLAAEHELPAKVIEYRQHAKLKGTYVDALPALVHPVTGRIHSSFKQDVAATGRLSSTEPNLQNIPVRTSEGRKIRAAFVPGEAEWSLLTADYSQIELRVLAHYSEDAALLSAFERNVDIHTLVASQVYGVEQEQVTAEMRRSAKAVNFGVIYGQSPFGLAQALGIEQEEAAQFIDAYFAQYVGVEKFMQKVLEECRRNGYVSTVLGRRRAVRGVRDPSRVGTSRLRNLPERIAINTVIQGSAADLIKQAMINVSSRMQLERLQARMLLQIHDELVFEVPSSELDTLSSLVNREMTSVGQLRVPLQVDMKVGANWAECEVLMNGQQ